MNPATLRAMLSDLGWSVRDLARMIDRPFSTVGNWSRGDGQRYPIPTEVAAWLMRRHAAHVGAMERDPPPRTTTIRQGVES